MSDNTKPSVKLLKRISKRKKTIPLKYRDTTPDDPNPKRAMRNPYKKEPTERFSPSERTTVTNPYEKTTPPQSQPLSETKPQSFSVSPSNRTKTNPYKTPYEKITPPQSQPFSETKPWSFSVNPPKRTMTNRYKTTTPPHQPAFMNQKQLLSQSFSVSARQHPSVFISVK